MKEKFKNSGAIALILVIMITAITIVSSIVVSLINISDRQANYHFSESEEAKADMNACLDDALVRLASSTSASGNFNLDTASINCVYQISSLISGGLKTVTSTASSTSDVGFWENEIVALINVSTTPISVNSYKNSKLAYSSYTWCGDGVTGGTEVCDDGNTTTEGCGDGVKQNGTYCNATCTATVVLSETCDHTGVLCSGGTTNYNAVGCSKNPYCDNACSICTSICL